MSRLVHPTEKMIEPLFLCHDYHQCQMTVIEIKENGAIRTKMLS